MPLLLRASQASGLCSVLYNHVAHGFVEEDGLVRLAVQRRDASGVGGKRDLRCKYLVACANNSLPVCGRCAYDELLCWPWKPCT